MNKESIGAYGVFFFGIWNCFLITTFLPQCLLHHPFRGDEKPAVILSIRVKRNVEERLI